MKIKLTKRLGVGGKVFEAGTVLDFDERVARVMIYSGDATADLDYEPAAPETASKPAPAPGKRPRGRPRKHPRPGD